MQQSDMTDEQNPLRSQIKRLRNLYCRVCRSVKVVVGRWRVRNHGLIKRLANGVQTHVSLR